MATATALPALLLLLPLLATLLLPDRHVIVVAASPSSPLRCRSGWTNSLQTVESSRIDDGYCDCPYDGIDEPNTGACSGSMDGMWAGIPPKHESSDLDTASPPAHFGCPQQPSLQLPLSRVDDGICDCCDGADERPGSSFARCPDICDQVLAEERAALEKARHDFEAGSKKRSESMNQFRRWYTETQREIQKIRKVDLAAAEKELDELEISLTDAKLALAKDWIGLVEKQLSSGHMVGNADPQYFASFIISLCHLASEASRAEHANDRCVALDRASLDVGIIWDYDTFTKDDSKSLPSYSKLDAETNESLVEYAEKLITRMEGKDTAKAARPVKSRRREPEYDPDEYSSGDDYDNGPYGDDWEDRYDHYNDHDHDDYLDGEEAEMMAKEGEETESLVDADGEADKKEEEPQLSPSEALVKSLLDKVSVDRTLFKDQSKVLLAHAPEIPEDEDPPSGDESEGESQTDSACEGGEGEEGECASSETSDESKVDPMAIRMVKSSLTKNLANINWGEISARSAAIFVASVIENGGDSAMMELKNLATMTLYHSKVGAEEAAELVYSTFYGFLPPKEAEVSPEGNKEALCSAPWSTMCPPTKFTINGQTHPPQFIIDAANKVCKDRENVHIACEAQSEGDEVDFPASIPDGYYNYYAPKQRGDEDAMTAHFSDLDAMRRMPRSLVDMRKRKDELDKEKSTLNSKASDLERETGEGGDNSSPKYGVDGELYALRDTCHKVESGKYEYEVCVFGKATQRDVGQKSGGTNLGSWEKEEMDYSTGQRTLKWGGGTKCWNGPVRSAEVVVTCGAETRLLTADEPDTCRYVLTMESPIGCDERFRRKNNL